MKRIALTSLCFIVTGVAVLSTAQTPAGQKVQFEVASIKQAAFPSDAYFNGYSSAGPCVSARLSISGNRVTLGQASICGLIGTAYDFREYLVMGGPDWIRTAARSIYYDIQASAPDSKDALSRDRALQMLQALLTDRFRLKSHTEKRDLPVYGLVVSKNGPKFSLNENGWCATALKNGTNAGVIIGAGLVASCKPMTMAQLADRLSQRADRPVLDRTGIEGGRTFELRWDGNTSGNPSDAPSLFTAIQEQLGLKLESTKALVEVLVIDSVSRPSEN